MPFTRDLAEMRRHMLDHDLAERGIVSPRLLAAMARVPRERFVPPDMQAAAYDDRALPIACDQTISQPYIVALMTDALELTGREKVLEVGTGSGYQTALLAELAGQVISLERHAPLSRAASALLGELGYTNAQFHVGDGWEGWPEAAPYDRILVAAAAASCPVALWRQLREGGIMVLPLGPPAAQELVALRKIGGTPQALVLSPCRFVPLVPGLPTAETMPDRLE